MRTLSSALVLILAPAAFADDPLNFLELCWRIGPDGAVVVWPDERLTEDTADFTPLFPADTIREALLSGPELAVLALSAGDLLSATDAEYHFRKLRLGTEEELLVARVSAYGERYATDGNGPLFRRTALDRLLAFRLAESRSSDWLRTICERILTGKGAFGNETTPERDPFLRAAARRTLDRLAGKATSRPPSLPAEVPDGCAVYASVDWRRIPVAPYLMRVWNLDCMRRGREFMRYLGPAISMEDYAAAQLGADRRAEFPYEIVRRFGNMMLSRAFVAGNWGDEPSGIVRAEGILEVEQLRSGLKALGVPLREEAEALAFEVKGMNVRASASGIELRTGKFAPAPAPPALIEELKAAGLGGTDALWVDVRDASGIPFLAAAHVERLTVHVSFGTETTACADAVCRDETAANGFVNTLKQRREELAAEVLKGADPEAVESVPEPGGGVETKPALADPDAAARIASLLRSARIEADGRRVAITVQAAESVDRLFALIVAAWPSDGRITTRVR